MWSCIGRSLLPRATPLLATAARAVVARRAFVSPTAVRREAQTANVPSMGDSITEGTVVEWTVPVGGAVQAEDVVAMIETDKVTVEIKAEISGVVTKHFTAVDETVEVGSPLYEIDADATATVTAESSNAEPAEKVVAPKEPESPVAAAVPVASGSTSSSSAPHRTPSIHFLGKEGWEQRLRGEEVPVVFALHPMYGRPPITEEEMEALMLGGADQAPNIVAGSSY